jgi:hypothetical protein
MRTLPTTCHSGYPPSPCDIQQPVVPDDLPRLPYLAAVLDEALRLAPPGDAALRKQGPGPYTLRDGRM